MDSSGNVFRSVLICFALTLSACGGGGYGDDDSGVANAPPAPPQAGIGPAGGTVNGPNGSQVVIPPNALATTTPIAIALTTAGSPPLPGGLTPTGSMFAFTPHGTAFAVPVTVTLPFDPTLVAAGTTAALFKTNAQSQWERVANATFGATSVTGQVSSFSDFQVVTEPLDAEQAVRNWSFSELLSVGKKNHKVGTVESGGQTGGVLKELRSFGGASFDSGLVLIDGTTVPKDDIANGVIGSSEDGRNLQIVAEAPAGNANNDDSLVGLRSEVIQHQAFVKREADATLSFKTPLVRIETHDENAILGRVCPTNEVCPLVMAGVTVDITGIKIEDFQNDPPPEEEPVFFKLHSSAPLGGFAKHWFSGTFSYADSMFPVWDENDFDLDITNFNGKEESKVVFTLVNPRTFNVDLSSIDVGERFVLRIVLNAFARNLIAGPPSELPTSAGAYLNIVDADAGQGGGGSLTLVNSTGLDPADVPTPFPDPPPVLVPPAPCVPGPGAAGTLQFSAAGYSVSEAGSGDVPTITVTRTAGSTGNVTATFSTVGGTAIDGSDFTGMTSTVFFADGDNAPRVIDVPILDDVILEPGETVILELSQPGGCAVLGAQNGAVLTILDDEPVPPGPSGLDPTFSGDGKATLERFGGDRSGMAVQPDGKVVMVGGTFVDWVMARFNADGSIDQDFGDDGKVTTNFTNNVSEESLGVAIQPDNKIVVVGYSGLSVALARYLPDGTLDDTFGVDGKAFTSVVGRAFAVALQPDGKIVIAGDVPSTEDWLIARFNANGSSDFSFANGGLTTDINVGGDLANNLLLQPDGFIVISGPHTNFGDTVREQHTGLMRVDASGVPDNTFGTLGKVLLTGVSVGEGLVRQSTGKYVLAGRINVAAPSLLRNEFLLMRLGANGTPDNTFGTAGKTQTQITTLSDEVLALALQADDKIIAAGRSRAQVNSNFAVARYDSEGVLDPSFANGGKLEIEFFGFTDIAESVVVQSNGKIVLGGLARDNVDGYGVARVNP